MVGNLKKLTVFFKFPATFLNQLTTLCKFVEISFTIIFEISTMFFFLVRDQCFHTKRFARFRTYHIYHC